MTFSQEIIVADRRIGKDQPCYVIAEAGVNHNGDMGLAKRLIDSARAAGADAVKFQTFKTEALNTRTAPKATYHIETTGDEQSWFDLLKSQELSRAQHELLLAHCNDTGIQFLSTPYDEASVDLLVDLGLPAIKVASTDLNNVPLISYIAATRIPMILSTAMSTLGEVGRSVRAIQNAGQRDLILLHCTANYPSALADTNLRAMLTLRDEFGALTGYSDHCPGYVNPVAATALGAVVYEKHFTMDRSLPGPDHRASLDPAGLATLVDDIRQTETALGDGVKRPVPAETENRQKLRKSIVATTAIRQGDRITRAMLTTKRPGSGMQPALLEGLVGLTAAVDISADTLVTDDMFRAPG
jgi:N,N'-diacetyllegionaminate synthase